MKKKLLSALLSAVMVMMPLGVHAGESETISQDAAELAPQEELPGEAAELLPEE